VVLFNVWGTWCGECRAEHSALLEIAKRGEVPVIGLDWKDEDPTASNGFKISAIPTKSSRPT